MAGAYSGNVYAVYIRVQAVVFAYRGGVV